LTMMAITFFLLTYIQLFRIKMTKWHYTYFRTVT
jgi:hypothetical protein